MHLLMQKKFLKYTETMGLIINDQEELFKRYLEGIPTSKDRVRAKLGLTQVKQNFDNLEKDVELINSIIPSIVKFMNFLSYHQDVITKLLPKLTLHLCRPGIYTRHLDSICSECIRLEWEIDRVSSYDDRSRLEEKVHEFIRKEFEPCLD